MLGLRHVTQQLKPHDNPQKRRVPLSLVFAVGLDLLVDGLLIGLGFTAGENVGVLLTLALTLELLFLGVSVMAELTERQVPRETALLTLVLLSSAVLAGTLLGLTLLSGLTGPLRVGTLAFGASALLYLVTEEVLTEAHGIKETPLITGGFFAGFLMLYVLEQWI